MNDPRLLEKNLRFAADQAVIGGDVDRINEFDLAAAAFPNPTPLVAATYAFILFRYCAPRRSRCIACCDDRPGY